MNALDTIINEIDDKVLQLKDHLASGRTTSYEDYKHLCGQISGLLFTREYTLSLKQNIEESDD